MQRTVRFNWSVVMGLGVILSLVVGVFILVQRLLPKKEATTGPDTAIITLADSEYRRQAYEALIAEFRSQYPNIEVRFVSLDNVTGRTNLDLGQLASLADTMVLPAMPQGAEINYFLDLRPLMDGDPAFSPNSFWPDSLTSCESNGHAVGLPLAVRPSLIFFDGMAFDAAGLPRPVPGWTWDDFRRAAEVLTQRSGGQVTRYGFVDRGVPLVLLGPLADAIIQNTDAESAPMALAQALGWYVDLAHAEAIPTFTADEDAVRVGDALISKRQTAMWVGGLNDLPPIRSTLGSDIGVAPYPITSDGIVSGANKTTRIRTSCVGISAGTAYPQAAWAWVNFLITHPPVRALPGEIPARPAVAEANGYWKEMADDMEPALRFALTHAWYGYISTEPLQSVGQALAQAISGGTRLESALAIMDLTVATNVPPMPNGTPIVVATPQPAATPEANMALSGDGIMIDYLVDSNFDMGLEALKPLAEAFNQAHSNMVVRLTDARTAYADRGYSPAEITQGFDCFASAAGLGSYYRDQIYSFEPLLEADTEETSLLADIYPFLLDMNRVEGELYGLPVASQPTVMYYNADHLDKLGLEPPALNWTVDDFWKLAMAATLGQGQNKVYGFMPYQWGVDGIEFLLAGENLEVLYDLTVVPPVVRFDDPAVLRGVSQLVDMAEAGVIPLIDDGGTHSLDGNFSQRNSWVALGQAALWTNAAGLRDGFYYAPDGPGFKVGVAPLPLGAGPLAPPTRAVVLYISRRAKDPSACWEWIKFLSEQPSAFVGIPARRSVAESTAYEAAVGSRAAAAYRAVLSQPVRLLPAERASENLPGNPLMFWWQDALAVTLAGTEPAVALTDLQRKSEAYVNCMITAKNSDAEQWIACAKQADPEFKTREELYQEQGREPPK